MQRQNKQERWNLSIFLGWSKNCHEGRSLCEWSTLRYPTPANIWLAGKSLILDKKLILPNRTGVGCNFHNIDICTYNQEYLSLAGLFSRVYYFSVFRRLSAKLWTAVALKNRQETRLKKACHRRALAVFVVSFGDGSEKVY